MHMMLLLSAVTFPCLYLYGWKSPEMEKSSLTMQNHYCYIHQRSPIIMIDQLAIWAHDQHPTS